MKLTVKTLQGVAFSIDAEITDTVRPRLMRRRSNEEDR